MATRPARTSSSMNTPTRAASTPAGEASSSLFRWSEAGTWGTSARFQGVTFASPLDSNFNDCSLCSTRSIMPLYVF